jgi:hypothetical protein
MKNTPVAQLLAYVTGLVNQQLLLQNEYLVAENKILREHVSPVDEGTPQGGTLCSTSSTGSWSRAVCALRGMRMIVISTFAADERENEAGAFPDLITQIVDDEIRDRNSFRDRTTP